jgi:BirA family transcriptional regulator, biotin operon repressor / biotin---[acetyl-CoA-carboxylase] ligase
LLAGLAVCRALSELGVGDLRMRWPNDVMVQRRKLAGLLIDQFVPGLAVIGIGINVRNRPEEKDPALRPQVTRLADLLPSAPPIEAVLGTVLSHLKALYLEWRQLGSEALLPSINGLWRWPGAVEIDLDGRILRGQFEGVDDSGRLRIRGSDGATECYQPHQVRLLREID